jgi:ABC-type Fe3+/spermidine/putrescine transport system ATPase subunit
MLQLADIHKNYEGQPLLTGISFTVAADETVCLLGPSGSGKSTLLRIIAGLETAEQGTVCWDGQDMASIPVHQRNFGLVFQDYALFPHLLVFDNVAFGLRRQNLPKNEIEPRVADSLKQVNLATFASRQVTELSGGEQQRVALARALAPRPRLLMADEPLGALDRSLRERLLDELRGILRSTRIPAIYVTHDQEEAFAIADRVLLLHEGKIVRQGSPSEVWNEPRSAWEARFLGLGNVLEGVARLQVGKARPACAGAAGTGELGEGLQVETPVGVFELDCGHPHQAGEKVCLLLRPAGVRFAAEGNLRGVVADVLFHQDGFKVTLANGLYFYLPEAPQVGKEIRLDAPPTALRCLGASDA